MEQRYFFTKVHYKTSLQNIKTFKADSTCERFLRFALKLTHQIPKLPSHRNPSIDLQSTSIDLFLCYGNFSV